MRLKGKRWLKADLVVRPSGHFQERKLLEVPMAALQCVCAMDAGLTE